MGTIWVAMYGQGQTWGRCAVLGIPAAFEQSCSARLSSDRFELAYLFCFLKNQYEQLQGMAHGGNQANLKSSDDQGFQRVFAEKLDLISSMQSQQSAATVNTEDAFGTLLTRVFSTYN